MTELFDEYKLADEIITKWGPAGAHAEVYHDLRAERDGWRALAVHLADCWAAEMHMQAGRKATSQSQRRRLKSIASTATASIQQRRLVGVLSLRRSPEDVIERLREAADAL